MSKSFERSVVVAATMIPEDILKSAMANEEVMATATGLNGYELKAACLLSEFVKLAQDGFAKDIVDRQADVNVSLAATLQNMTNEKEKPGMMGGIIPLPLGLMKNLFEESPASTVEEEVVEEEVIVEEEVAEEETVEENTEKEVVEKEAVEEETVGKKPKF